MYLCQGVWETLWHFLSLLLLSLQAQASETTFIGQRLTVILSCFKVMLGNVLIYLRAGFLMAYCQCTLFFIFVISLCNLSSINQQPQILKGLQWRRFFFKICLNWKIIALQCCIDCGVVYNNVTQP